MNTSVSQNLIFSLLLCAFGAILLGLATNQVLGVALSPLGWLCLVPLFFSIKNTDSARSFFGRTYLFSVLFLSLVITAFVLRSFTGGVILIFIGAFFFTLPFWVVHFSRAKIGFRKSLFLLALIWPAFDWFILE